MQVEVDVKCMQTIFGGRGLFSFENFIHFLKRPKFPYIYIFTYIIYLPYISIKPISTNVCQYEWSLPGGGIATQRTC